MASQEITSACDRVLAELMGLKRRIEAVSEDLSHPLHNPILVTAVADGMVQPVSTGTQRCFEKVEAWVMEEAHEPLSTRSWIRRTRAWRRGSRAGLGV